MIQAFGVHIPSRRVVHVSKQELCQWQQHRATVYNTDCRSLPDVHVSSYQVYIYVGCLGVTAVRITPFPGNYCALVIPHPQAGFND